MKRIVLMLVVVLAAFSAAQAQPAYLSERFTSANGMFTVLHPDGWFVQDGSVLQIANTQAALETQSVGDAEILFTLADGNSLSALSVEVSVDPVVTAQNALDRFGRLGDVRLYRRTALTGASSLVVSADFELGYLAVLNFGTGPVLVTVDFGPDFPDNPDWYLDLTHDIIGALVYNGQSAADGRVVAPVSTETAFVRQWASSATGTSQYGENGWSFMQATGAPNVDGCTDSTAAWASATSGSSEILALEFEQAVYPVQVDIYQTYNPGSITRIELTNTDTGEIFPIAGSADTPGNTPCPGVFTVNMPAIDAKVNGVILYFDQSIGGSWNEIDAVELIGIDGGETVAETPAMPEPTAASPAEAGTTLTFNGEFSIEYPEGWVTNTSALPMVASDEDAVRTMQVGAALPPGGVAIGIVPPSGYGQLGVTAAGSVDEVIAALVAVFGGETDIQPATFTSYDAVFTPLVGTVRLPAHSHLLVVEHSGQIFTFIVVAEDFDVVKPVLTAMIDSLTVL